MRIVLAVFVVLALAAGIGGMATYAYHLGVAQGLAESGKLPVPGPGVTPYGVYPYGYPVHWFPGFGFGFFGLFWTVLLVFLVLALARGMFWRGWDRRRGGGPPPWFEEWHRRAHESAGGGAGA